MARSKGTFQPGHPKRGGRKKGTPNRVPVGLKASLRRAIEEIVREEYAAVKAAVRAGLLARPPKSFAYLQLAAYYLDGKPVDHFEIKPMQPMYVFPPGTDPTTPDDQLPAPVHLVLGARNRDEDGTGAGPDDEVPVVPP